MKPVAIILFLLAIFLTGCGNKTESFEGELRDIEADGFVVDCSEEVNKGKTGDISTVGYGCLVEYTNETAFLDENGGSLTPKDFSPGATVKVVLSEPANIRNYVEDQRPSAISAKEISLLARAKKPLTALPVDQIRQITVLDSGSGNIVAVLIDKQQFRTFSDAIAGAEIATGEIIAIGENYEFVVEYESSQQRFSYWNGPHLKMIYDQDTNYFLSDDAVDIIDLIITEATPEQSNVMPVYIDETKYKSEELKLVQVIHQSVKYQNEGDEVGYMNLLADNSGLNFPSSKVRKIEIVEIAVDNPNELSAVVTTRTWLEGDGDGSVGFYVLNKEGAEWKILDKD